MQQHITARGSVTKRVRKRKNGTTYIVFRAQVPDPRLPANTKRNVEKVFAVPAYGSIKAARQAADDWRAEQLEAMRTGKWQPDPDGVTLAEVAEAWRATWPLDDLAKRTQLGYTNILNRRVLPKWGGMRVDAITAYAIQPWINELAAERHTSTVKNAYNVLRCVLRHAVRQGLIEANPCSPEHIKLPGKKRRRHASGGSAAGVALTTAELVQLVGALPDGWQTPVMLAAMTGMRAAEVWGLTRADWDASVGALTIQQTLCDVGGELVVAPPKTEASERIVFAPEPLPGMLSALAAAPGVRLRGVKAGQPRGYPAVVAGDDGPELGYVEDPDDPRRLMFTTPSGHAVQHSNFYRRVYRPVVVRLWPAGHRLHRARFHDLRHSIATQRLDDGDTPTDVMKLLGHSQLSTTTDLYGRHRQLAAAKATADRTAAAWASVSENGPRLHVVKEGR